MINRSASLRVSARDIPDSDPERMASWDEATHLSWWELFALFIVFIALALWAVLLNAPRWIAALTMRIAVAVRQHLQPKTKESIK